MLSVRALLQGIQPFRSRKRFLVFLLCLLAVCFSAAQLWALYEFSRGNKAIKDMKLEAAQRHLSCCMLIWPTSAKVKLLAARVERLSGRFEKAEALLAECKTLSPQSSPSVQLELLLIRAQRGELDALAPFFFQCVKEGHPDSALILETMADLALGLNRFHEAFVCLDKWLELEPANIRAHDLRGYVRELMGQNECAIEDYEVVLAAEPDRFRARVHLPGVYLGVRKADQAAKHAEYLTNHYPSRPEGWVLLARCYHDQGKYAEAATLIDQTLEQHPEDPDALLWGGIFSFRLARYAEAAGRLEKAVELSPNHRMALEYWHRGLLRLHDPRATAVLERLHRLVDRQGRLDDLQMKDVTSGNLSLDEQMEAGNLYLQFDMDRQGVHWLTRVLRAEPKNVAAHRLLADYYRKHNDPSSADYHQKMADAAAATLAKP